MALVANYLLGDRVTRLIGTAPDWPIEGVMFTDVNSIWEGHPDVFQAMVTSVAKPPGELERSIPLRVSENGHRG